MEVECYFREGTSSVKKYAKLGIDEHIVPVVSQSSTLSVKYFSLRCHGLNTEFIIKSDRHKASINKQSSLMNKLSTIFHRNNVIKTPLWNFKKLHIIANSVMVSSSNQKCSSM